MMRPPLTIFLLLTITIIAQAIPPSAIIEFTRHGARGPILNTFDPSWSTLGELTSVGMHQHFMIGQSLLQKYPNILAQAYNPENIYVRATDVNRTIMSAVSQLSSIYYQKGSNLTITQAEMAIPPYNNAKEIAYNYSNSTALPFNFFIPPIHVVQYSQDYFLRPGDLCHYSKQNIFEDLLASPTFQEFLNFTSPIVEGLNMIYNISSQNNYSYYGWLGDTLIADEFANKTIPVYPYPILSKEWNDTVFLNYADLFFSYTGTPKVRAMLSVPIYPQLLSYMNGIINETNTLQYMFFSAHDTTLINILGGLNITIAECFVNNYINNITNNSLCQYPTFASQFIIEMYNETETYSNWYVNLYYKDIPLYSMVTFTGYQMTFNEFEKLLTNAMLGYTMQDYYQYCNYLDSIDEQGDLKYATFGMAGVTATLFLVLLITIGKKLSMRSMAGGRLDGLITVK